MMHELLASAAAIEAQIIADRRYLHTVPEIGMNLPQTTMYVRKRLEEMGYAVQDCGPCGLTALAGKPGPTFLLRGDMDALATAELSGCPFKATNGNGHLCGHDLSTAQLLGAAWLLKKYEQRLKGCVKLMFQPGEETIEGARSMIAHGILENPKVDAAMACHAMSNQERGTVRFFKGIATSSLDIFRVRVQGRGSHGSMPELGVDPLHIVASIYTMLSGLVSRESSSLHSSVLTVGMLGGGDSPNTIPDSAILEGTIRSYWPEDRAKIVAKLKSIIDNVTRTLGGTYTAEFIDTPSVVNDAALCEAMTGPLQEVFGKDQVQEMPRPIPASEDFANIAQQVPSMFWLIGTGSPSDYPVHNPHVIFDESSMHKVSAALAGCAMTWLEARATDK